jgi:hypothetical protein
MLSYPLSVKTQPGTEQVGEWGYQNQTTRGYNNLSEMAQNPSELQLPLALEKYR